MGTVRSIDPDPQFPTPGKNRVYRFQIETSYKGLPQNVTQVVVNPDNFTSCQTAYKRGVRYLIFGRRYSATNEVLSAGCDGSRLADAAPEDLQYLEGYKRNEVVNSVFGRVLQSVNDFRRLRSEEGAPVAGANVTLSNALRAFTHRSNETGAFRFTGIPAGAYNLSARLAPYIANPTPTRNLLQVFDGNELVGSSRLSLWDRPTATHQGIVECSGYAERQYELNARYWIDNFGGDVPADQRRAARSEPVRLGAGKSPAAVRLVLARTVLGDDDQ